MPNSADLFHETAQIFCALLLCYIFLIVKCLFHSMF